MFEQMLPSLPIVTFTAQSEDVRPLLDRVCAQAHVKLLATSHLRGAVTADCVNVPLNVVVKAICKSAGLNVKIEGRTVSVTPKSPAQNQ
jgi:hypothetical protein